MAETLHGEGKALCWSLPASPTFSPQPLPSFLSFFLSAFSPSPSSPSQKLSVHSHFLWLLSLSPDLMRTIWGKEVEEKGVGKLARTRPSSQHLSTPLRLCGGQLAHFAPNSPNWSLAAGVRGAEGRDPSRVGGSEGDLCSRTTFLGLEQAQGL